MPRQPACLDGRILSDSSPDPSVGALGEAVNTWHKDLRFYGIIFFAYSLILIWFEYITHPELDALSVYQHLLLSAGLTTIAVFVRDAGSAEADETLRLKLVLVQRHIVHAAIHIVRDLLVVLKRLRVDATNLEPWQIITIIQDAEKKAENQIKLLADIEHPDDKEQYTQINL